MSDYTFNPPPEPIKQVTPSGQKVLAYSAEYITELWQMGFKPVPTFKNAVAFNTDNLVTEEEFAKFPAATHIAIRVMYLDVDFWSIERIKKESWRFEDIRTLLGITYIRDNQGEKISVPYTLCATDIDSANAYRSCQSDLESDYVHNTYVTKTRKEYARHIYWLETYLNDNDFVPIDQGDCKVGNEFELFVGLQYLQIAGQHRKDSNFRYGNIGCIGLTNQRIMVRNGEYDRLISDTFKELLVNPVDIEKRRKQQRKSKDPFHSHSLQQESIERKENIVYIQLTDSEINLIVIWAERFYGMNNHYYYFMRAFVGTLVHSYIAEEYVQRVIDKICNNKFDIRQKSKWYSLLRKAYQLLEDGLDFQGQPTLVKQIQRTLVQIPTG